MQTILDPIKFAFRDSQGPPNLGFENLEVYKCGPYVNEKLISIKSTFPSVICMYVCMYVWKLSMYVCMFVCMIVMYVYVYA